MKEASREQRPDLRQWLTFKGQTRKAGWIQEGRRSWQGLWVHRTWGEKSFYWDPITLCWPPLKNWVSRLLQEAPETWWQHGDTEALDWSVTHTVDDQKKKIAKARLQCCTHKKKNTYWGENPTKTDVPYTVLLMTGRKWIAFWNNEGHFSASWYSKYLGNPI